MAVKKKAATKAKKKAPVKKKATKKKQRSSRQFFPQAGDPIGKGPYSKGLFYYQEDGKKSCQSQGRGDITGEE